MSAPSGLVVPQESQVATAIVISKAKIAPSTPPAALPSRCWSGCSDGGAAVAVSKGSGGLGSPVGSVGGKVMVVSRSSRRPEALRLDALRQVAQALQASRDELDERRRAADVSQRALVR